MVRRGGVGCGRSLGGSGRLCPYGGQGFPFEPGGGFIFQSFLGGCLLACRCSTVVALWLGGLSWALQKSHGDPPEGCGRCPISLMDCLAAFGGPT